MAGASLQGYLIPTGSHTNKRGSNENLFSVEAFFYLDVRPARGRDWDGQSQSQRDHKRLKGVLKPPHSTNKIKEIRGNYGKISSNLNIYCIFAPRKE